MQNRSSTREKAKAYMLARRNTFMERKIKLGLILLVVLIGTASALYGISRSGAQEREINRLLDEANYCNVDSDCAVLNTTVGCPFGCYNLGNKDADITKIDSLWEAYQKQRSGTFCVYSCIISPTPEEIKCVNSKCVDTRFGN